LTRRRLQQTLLEFTAGGRWTYQLHPAVRENLRWFWLDGLFASASDAIAVAYLSLFVLTLGGTRAQIGLMNSLASLSAAIVLLPGAALVERLGRRRPIVLVGAAGARAGLLLLALMPLAFERRAAVYAAIGLVIVRSTSTHLGVPAWSALLADLVPAQWRGRYFSSRSIAMVVAGMATTLLFGQAISRIRAPLGYQVAFGVAFAIGSVATFSFSRIVEPPEPAAPSVAPDTRVSLWGQLRAHRNFVTFCGVIALWNFVVSIGGPFFSVFLVERLGATAGLVGTFAVVSSLAALPGHRLFGMLIDRWGPRRVQMMTGLAIPLTAVGWVLATSPWHVVPLYLLGGFLWAGYGAASLNVQLTLVPQARRARFSALLQIVVLIGLAAGAAVGGVVAERWGYRVAFAATGVGRLIVAVLFALFVREPARPPGLDQAQSATVA
jgi:MFS family permease